MDPRKCQGSDCYVCVISVSLTLGVFLDRLGHTLTDALDQMISEGSIDPQLAMKVLSQVRNSSGIHECRRNWS